MYSKYKKVKYADILEFFNELDEKDLTNPNKIVISTLHQSKGREFNSVIINFDEDFDWNKL
jgi:superfamily I DNA/RNA helicase